jgi:hypothetical protein
MGASSHSQEQSPMRVMRSRGKRAIESKAKKNRGERHYTMVSIGLTALNQPQPKIAAGLVVVAPSCPYQQALRRFLEAANSGRCSKSLAAILPAKIIAIAKT